MIRSVTLSYWHGVVLLQSSGITKHVYKVSNLKDKMCVKPCVSPEPEPEKTTPEPEPEHTKITPEPEPEKTTIKPEPEPNSCSYNIVHKCSMGGYTLDCFDMTWTFHEAKDTIEFTLSAVVAETEWVGVGFSETDSMTNADIYYGWHNNGVTEVHDSHTAGYRTRPTLDNLDLFNISGSRINGRTQLKFSRKRSTGEDQTKDVAFTDTKCYFILLAWGGSVTSSGITKHVYKVSNLKDKMCVKPCVSPEPEPEKTTPEPEPEHTKITPEPEPEKTTIKPEPEPNSCSYNIVHKCSMGGYTLDCFDMTWTFHEAKDTIEFTLSAVVAETEWVGVGFSETDSMTNADIYYGWHNNGVTEVHDSHTAGYRTRPTLDNLDLFNISGSRINGRTQLKFSRKRSTGEDQTKDVAFTDTKCYFILLAWGGSVTSSGITKHVYKVSNLKDKMCLKPCAKPEPEPETTATPEGEGEPGSCGPAPGVNVTTGDRPHSMDCVDMVIGSAKGQLSRIGDYYSRDRSTPLKDEFYGGSDDLTGGLGFEDDNGFTTIVFRKKIRAMEPTDHSFIDKPMHVIWARGQDEGNYVHNKQTPSGIDGVTTQVSDPQYYKVDELKYHGFTGHRGTTTINFFTEPTDPVGECKQEWGSCPSEGDCHHVEWVYNRVLDRVHFTMRARLRSKQWIGLGFSRDKSMTNTDTVVAWIDSQRVVHVVDGWIGNQYSMPASDPQQDIRGISGDIQDGITKISFNRARGTKDDKDIAFDGNDCIYIIFPKGGEYIDGTERFSRHDVTPTVSQQKICIPCKTGQTQPPITGSTPKPTEKFRIVVSFKVTSVPWSDVYRNPESREFKDLRWDIELSLNLLMSKLPGFSRVIVLQISRGSIKIEAALEFDGNKTQAKTDVQTVFDKAIETGTIGTYSIDTNIGSFSIGDPEAVQEVANRPPETKQRDDADYVALWVIVGLASGAFVLVLILACGNYKRMKKPKEKESDDEFKSLSLGTSSPTDVHYNGYKSDKKQGLSIMNMAYEDWKEKNEAERVPSTKSSQNKYKIPSNNGMMETF
ncbi:hypothetical protein KUTeg_017120 [Tegillarca granosa]|uniref:DOMON domain-containing protein n=1 Tax=Tegillarca granosa TaxID=220873 RepID=A0ABQ9EN29_TEGGR|nr:hypothetical protein KUTeg_017120 [Tegillarca granosa]